MKFNVVSNDGGEATASNDPKSQIESLVSSAPVFLFMKGSPDAPQCGFSSRVIETLRGWNVPFETFNVLSDEGIRDGIKEYANWPTIPQLYVNKEFVGGCDIIEEMSGNGELGELFKEAHPNLEFTPPPPPVEVQNLPPEDIAELLKKQPDIPLLDVRGPEERAIACVAGARMIDQALAQEIVNSWDPNIPLVFMCHKGGRSLEAAQYFTQQGFQNVYNVVGGIDAWSLTVDSEIPRY